MGAVYGIGNIYFSDRLSFQIFVRFLQEKIQRRYDSIYNVLLHPLHCRLDRGKSYIRPRRADLLVDPSDCAVAVRDGHFYYYAEHSYSHLRATAQEK